jgi:uncharacterized protein YecT (DUF1311 family)
MTEAPWWAVPVIAGCFAIFGALVAFVSASLSDRRKGKRDDRRQWDKQLLEAYSDTVKQLEPFRFRGQEPLGSDDPAWGSYYADLSARAEVIRSNGALLHLVGDRRSLEATENLVQTAGNICALAHDHQPASKDQYREVRRAEAELTRAYQLLLRVNQVEANPRVRAMRDRRFRAWLHDKWYYTRQKFVVWRHKLKQGQRPTPIK